MIKVRALPSFETITDRTIERTRHAGEVFEVTEERMNVLNNTFGYPLVEKVEDGEVKTAKLDNKVKVKKTVQRSTEK